MTRPDARYWEIHSLLDDAVDGSDDDGRGYQSTAIAALATILARQEEQIAKLQQQVDELKKAQEAP